MLRYSTSSRTDGFTAFAVTYSKVAHQLLCDQIGFLSFSPHCVLCTTHNAKRSRSSSNSQQLHGTNDEKRFKSNCLYSEKAYYFGWGATMTYGS